jgi:hypothetical protein
MVIRKNIPRCVRKVRNRDTAYHPDIGYLFGFIFTLKMETLISAETFKHFSWNIQPSHLKRTVLFYWSVAVTIFRRVQILKSEKYFLCQNFAVLIYMQYMYPPLYSALMPFIYPLGSLHVDCRPSD